MCKFFSAIATRDGNVLFTEKDSHETVIARSGLEDDLSKFVRVEYDGEQYTVDEQSIPEWYERIAAKAEHATTRIYKRIVPWHGEYKKIEQRALDEYEVMQRPAWDEYEVMRRTALDKYRRTLQPAWNEYLHHIKTVDGFLAEEVRE